MNWIELIGPSGIGKTTFLNDLIRKDPTDRNWVSLSEGLYHVMMSSSGTGMKEKFKQLYFSQHLVNINKEAYLYRRIEESKIEEFSDYNIFIELFFKFIANKSLPAVEKINYINWHLHILKQFSLLDKNKFRTLIVMDEGPINNTPNLSQGNIKNFDVFPKACIFFHLDIDENLKRILKRSEKGIVRNIHRNKTENELTRHVQLDHYNFSLKRAFILEKGIPVLDIQLNEEWHLNIEKTLQFIEKKSGH